MATHLHHGKRIGYREEGQGPAVLLVHSGAFSAAQWDLLLPLLAPHARLLAIDLHGCGDSTRWPGPQPMTLDDEAELVLALAAREPGPVTLLGHSYGGAVALRAAIAKPEQWNALILLEPFSPGLLQQFGADAAHSELCAFIRWSIATTRRGQPHATMERFVDYWYDAPGMWQGLPEPARERVARSAVTLIDEAAALLGDYTTLEECSRIALPVHLLLGERTLPLLRLISEGLAAQVPGARLWPLPKRRHMDVVTRPAAFVEPILASLGLGAAGKPQAR